MPNIYIFFVSVRWTQRRMNYDANPCFHLQRYRNALDHMQEKDFIWRSYIQFPVPNLRDSRFGVLRFLLSISILLKCIKQIG
ncbi:unnamed protein product [Lathyrus sativus]|nr:unnamed protein product [Lathyrus sativus]